MAIRKNVKRIDPRYFLEETTNRGGINEARMTPEQQAQIDKMRDARGMTGEEFGEKHGNAGDIHSEQSPVPGKSAPKFGPVLIDWDSEVYMGLNIVYNAMKKSKSEPELLQWLSSLGYTQEEMEQQGEMIKGIIKGMMTSHPQWQGWNNQPAMEGVTLNIPPTAQAPVPEEGGGGLPEDWEPPPPGALDEPPGGIPGFGGISENKKRKRRSKRMRQSKLKETIKEAIQKKLS